MPRSRPAPAAPDSLLDGASGDLCSQPQLEVFEAVTVAVVHSIVASVMKAAVRDRRIPANPCEGTRLPKRDRAQLVPLTTNRVETLGAAVPTEFRALVTFAAGTGVRQGELLHFTLDRVHFLRREVTIDRQLLGVCELAPVWEPPKTEASYRLGGQCEQVARRNFLSAFWRPLEASPSSRYGSRLSPPAWQPPVLTTRFAWSVLEAQRCARLEQLLKQSLRRSCETTPTPGSNVLTNCYSAGATRWCMDSHTRTPPEVGFCVHPRSGEVRPLDAEALERLRQELDHHAGDGWRIAHRIWTSARPADSVRTDWG